MKSLFLKRVTKHPDTHVATDLEGDKKPVQEPLSTEKGRLRTNRKADLGLKTKHLRAFPRQSSSGV